MSKKDGIPKHEISLLRPFVDPCGCCLCLSKLVELVRGHRDPSSLLGCAGVPYRTEPDGTPQYLTGQLTVVGGSAPWPVRPRPRGLHWRRPTFRADRLQGSASDHLRIWYGMVRDRLLPPSVCLAPPDAASAVSIRPYRLASYLKGASCSLLLAEHLLQLLPVIYFYPLPSHCSSHDPSPVGVTSWWLPPPPPLDRPSAPVVESPVCVTGAVPSPGQVLTLSSFAGPPRCPTAHGVISRFRSAALYTQTWISELSCYSRHEDVPFSRRLRPQPLMRRSS